MLSLCALAAAIGAIVALFTTLWPDSDPRDDVSIAPLRTVEILLTDFEWSAPQLGPEAGNAQDVVQPVDHTAEQQSGQNWKSPKKPGCYAVTVTAVDGSSITALFQLN